MSSSTSRRSREPTDIVSPIKTYDRMKTSFTEECVLDDIAKEAELRLQHEREENREARQMRHKELERSFQDADDEDSSTVPHAPSATTQPTKCVTAQLNGAAGPSAISSSLQKFLNGDVDVRSFEHRDLRRLLSELESKYKRLMITNSSTYNEKHALTYQIDTYKDVLDEYYESLNQFKRQLKEKCKEFDVQKQQLFNLQMENSQLRETLINFERLIQESDMEITCDEGRRYVSAELLLSNALASRSINEKLTGVLKEKRQLVEQIGQLQFELDESKDRLKMLANQIRNANDLNHINGCEQQKPLIRQISDLTNQLQRLAADNASLQQENIRYEAQLLRYKQQLDDAERVENDLQQERRRLQRELRLVHDKLEDERTHVDVLQRENERLRSARKKDLLDNSDDKLVVPKSHSPSFATTSSDRQSRLLTEELL